MNNVLFSPITSYSQPNYSGNWLVVLANQNGKEKLRLFDLRKRISIPLPGINRSDSKPISVSVSNNGNIVALIRQRSDQIELIIYRRQSGTSRRIEILPKGVPNRVSIDGSGKILAVQVSRGGIWEIDLIRL
tara:strand:- start:38 stop:433 length:396 start_codon:yes stop_codon:yes gene_type:complete